MKRVLQILMLVIMAVFLAELFTPLHAANCATSLAKKDVKTTEISTKGTLADDAPVAFQLHGGDVAFGDGLRAAFKDELTKRMPQAKLVDGPPPKNSVSLLLTLKSADERWTPFYSHEGLGLHAALQLPGSRAGTQITADGDVDAVCTGLVAKSHFQSHVDVTGAIATWLVDQLEAARK